MKPVAVQRGDTSGQILLTNRVREMSPKGEVLDVAQSVADPKRLFKIKLNREAGIEMAYELPKDKGEW